MAMNMVFDLRILLIYNIFILLYNKKTACGLFCWLVFLLGNGIGGEMKSIYIGDLSFYEASLYCLGRLDFWSTLGVV